MRYKAEGYDGTAEVYSDNNGKTWRWSATKPGGYHADDWCLTKLGAMRVAHSKLRLFGWLYWLRPPPIKKLHWKGLRVMTPEKLEEKLAKMPAFVREEIARLRANVASLEQRLNVQRAQKTKVRSIASDGSTKLALPDDTTVRFTLRTHAEIDVRIEKNTLYIHTNGFGSTTIVPRASNCFNIAVLDKFL